MNNHIQESCQNTVPEVTRHTADFHQSVWGDFFLAYSSDCMETDSQDKVEHERLKEEVRKMLVTTPDQCSSQLDLIDVLQRLGVCYHFDNEIEESLRIIYTNLDDDGEDGNDLHVVAFRFRLLRQQGYRVSPDIFRKFKDREGNFKESLASDLRGMFSLYEAAHFRVHGENILEEALIFTTSHLELLLATMSDDDTAAAVLNQTLKLPIRKSLTRLQGRLYMNTYETDESHSESLLKFAKLDYNILQKMHQKELCELTEWWKNLDFEKNFPYARNRLVELYFWTLGIYFEPKYRLARRLFLKIIVLSSIIDDTYDAYGTIDELTLFTDAIDRMHIDAIDGLPPYMRCCYEALLDIYSEMEKELGKEGKEQLVSYVKADTQKLVRAYYEEAKWFNNGYVPRVDEYMENALVSCGYMLLATTSLIGMGELVTKETLDWVSNEPLIVRAASVICRLMSDMVGHELEQHRGHVASAIECYKNQSGASEHEAWVEFRKQVTDAWKDISSECLHPTAVPMPLLERVVNLARVIHLLYRDKDWYTHSTEELKELVTLMLVNPVKIGTECKSLM